MDVIMIEKIQQRRIVLEETQEDNQKNRVKNIWCSQFFSGGFVVSDQSKIWREVKETDIPLTNDEPKLSLSVDECKDLQVISSIKLSRKIQDFIGAHKHE